MISQYEFGKNSTNPYAIQLLRLCDIANAMLEQLFLEEEREREMEQIFEAETVNTLNRSDAAIGSGVQNAEDGNQAVSHAEASAVTKQTTETLMAGERIIEALDLADVERTSIAEYQKAIAGLSPEEVGKVPLPQKNAVLAAYELEPEAYVLKVVERINSSALLDALLVLPFGKVMRAKKSKVGREKIR